MEISILSNSLSLPDLLEANGRLKLLPAESYDQISHDALRVWCNQNARYGLPTTELVAWLRERINGRKAIEIGAGSGDLAHYLGIAATDNRMQEWPEIRQHYAIMRQPVIKYPSEVHTLDAVEAVEFYHPEVVIASWVTEWIDPNLPPPESGGNVWGVKEDEILKRVCTYILIGNVKIHGQKKIMALPHEEYNLSFIRSRATSPELNRVWIWQN